MSYGRKIFQKEYCSEEESFEERYRRRQLRIRKEIYELRKEIEELKKAKKDVERHLELMKKQGGFIPFLVDRKTFEEGPIFQAYKEILEEESRKQLQAMKDQDMKESTIQEQPQEPSFEEVCLLPKEHFEVEILRVDNFMLEETVEEIYEIFEVQATIINKEYKIEVQTADNTHKKHDETLFMLVKKDFDFSNNLHPFVVLDFFVYDPGDSRTNLFEEGGNDVIRAAYKVKYKSPNIFQCNGELKDRKEYDTFHKSSYKVDLRALMGNFDNFLGIIWKRVLHKNCSQLQELFGMGWIIKFGHHLHLQIC